MEKRLFTSECVTTGHPDKVADRISDSILDACLAQDPNSRVACETLVTTDFCCISGEITTSAAVDYEAIARQVIRDIGYTGGWLLRRYGGDPMPDSHPVPGHCFGNQ